MLAEMERLGAREGREAMVRIRLTGTATFGVDVESLLARARESFYVLDIAGEPQVLGAEVLRQWATEPTLRGEFIRRINLRMESARTIEERAVLRRAMLNGLKALQGGAR